MTPPILTDEDDILAAELALGLLDSVEAAALAPRMAADAAFAARVDWWRNQLAPLAQRGAVEAPPSTWQNIAARLPANDNLRTVRRWQGISAVLGTVAAALLVVVVTRVPVEAPQPVANGPQLAAGLAGERGNAVAITYDGASRRMMIAPVKLDSGPGDAELWIIPVGATVPVSLGVIDAAAPQVHQMDAAQAAMMVEGATFAISQEPRGGSPTGKATGPIVASGKIVTT